MFELLAISSLLINVVCWLVGGGLIIKYIWYTVSFNGGVKRSLEWMQLILTNVIYLAIDVGVVLFVKWLTGHTGTELLAVGGAFVAAVWSVMVFCFRKGWIKAENILKVAEH